MPQQFMHAQNEATNQQDDQSHETVLAHDTAAVQDDALDAVLDDIESTLETNAEDYVNSFVQKGGE
ncbi:ubiquitin-like protein Pup [Bifidobacterium leontopitheci]|uniref:Prokaryotic ubiquitin-like protein Pup n=1 Tax=Bifidobacterium leontopitheci TaxID=2650774 RepID=A0A6I1GY66_9BIFI|nr:ubiquitin-like protein Pup [Bifidobacterium leontopitheci]KAB7791401.1 Prokaryotic ubiquitin-like protein Pup [Bifidobacterium leontopitheci]